MAKTRSQKEAMLEEYKSFLENETGGFIAVDPAGVDTATITDLKKQLKQEGANISVVKNSVFKIALQDKNYPLEATDFSQQTAVITYTEDPTSPAKLIKEIQKKTEAFAARFGVIAGGFIKGENVMQLADIPSREELLAKMLGSMMSPLTGFMSVANGAPRQFVQVVSQVAEKGGNTEAEAPAAEEAVVETEAVSEADKAPAAEAAAESETDANTEETKATE